MKRQSVVIGAGIVGASCAWHLQRKGQQVTLIDPELPGDACSFGNASCIATSGVVPLSGPGIIKKVPGWLMDPLGPVTIRVKHFPALVPWLWKFWRVCNMRKVEEIAAAQATLMHTVLADWDEMLAAAGAVHLKQSPGTIHLYDTEQEYRDDQWQFDLSRRLGFEHHRLSAIDLESMVPMLKLEKGVALMAPDWHHLIDPAKATACIADDCMRNGGHWIRDRVTAVDTQGSGVSLKTGSGDKIEADHLVVAAGAWSNALAEQLDYKVPLIAERGYHSQIGNPGLDLKYPVMSLTRHFVMTPLENGLRVAGTAEFAALDAEPDYRRAKVLLELAGNYLDGLQTNDVTEWMGQRPAMPDSLPVISVSPGHPKVFYAFGHGHYGITQGPTTGRIIADLVTGAAPSVDISPFRFDRFLNPKN
ncbi:MAG: FAD-binding oxidoreductase [Lysobacterales bacterium]